MSCCVCLSLCTFQIHFASRQIFRFRYVINLNFFFTQIVEWTRLARAISRKFVTKVRRSIIIQPGPTLPLVIIRTTSSRDATLITPNITNIRNIRIRIICIFYIRATLKTWDSTRIKIIRSRLNPITRTDILRTWSSLNRIRLL